MSDFANAIRRIAGTMDRQVGQMRKGVVQSYNPANYTARVLVQPEGNLSGWLPIRALTGGNGWGVVVGLVPGMQVSVEPQEGDPGSLEITGIVFAYQGGVVPPPVPAGEIWVVNETGDYVKLTATGIQSFGTWSHTGDFRATGEVYRGYGGGDQVSLGGHTHDQPADSAGDSEQPTSAPNPGT